MRLKKLKITGYRSIKQEEPLFIDGRVTILIGANDHGKSNILAAIQCLNDDSPITTDDKNWDADDASLVEIKWYFSCTDDDIEKLNQIEAQSLIDAQPVPQAESTTQPETTPQPEPTPQSNQTTNPEQKPKSPQVIESAPREVIPVNDRGVFVLSRDSGTNQVRVVSLPTSVSRSNEKAVLSMRPRVELFQSPSANLIDQVNLTQLETADYEFMQGLFRLAGLWDDRKTIFAQNDKTSKMLDEASRRLTQILNDKWNQGKDLQWKLEHTGTNGDHIVIKIQDPAIAGRYTRPSLRSSGFRTYFLMSMIILARTQNKQANSFIYLFDEPGTYLHPHAQLDLQRSFEVIADNAQIVYTTHSLFLVSKNYPERNRVISKGKQGTKIDQKPFSKNWKSVRDSLGILLSNNFLIAEKTLIVEGPSDIIYLLEAVKELKRLEQFDVDLNDFSMVDSGDAQNYVAMTKLMLSEGRDIVALLDGDNGGNNLEAQLKRVCGPEIKNKRLRIHKIPEGKSSEDVFANLDTLKLAVRKTYDDLVNNQVRLPKPNLNIDDELQSIAPNRGNTLGRVLDLMTATLFDPEEKISKLSIALSYEDICETNRQPPPNDALAVLQAVKKLLNLRGEKSKETGIFEEVE